jgi:hypothetical protein
MAAAGILVAAAAAGPIGSATAEHASAPVATAAQGGLSVTPRTVEATARRGASRGVTIRNRSGRALQITVSPRGWRQGAGGGVTARRSGGLDGVGVNVRRFRMPNGANRTITVRMGRVPRLRAQYGALEVTGRPVVRRRGINVAYRLVSSLRFRPTARNRRVRLGAGGARVSRRRLLLPVVNRGNTIDPVGGVVSVSGRGRARSLRLGAKAILPNRRVTLSAGSLRGLPRGRYRAAVRLTQRGGVRLRVSRSFRIR